MENLVPQSTIDTFYKVIKERIDNERSFDIYIENLLKLNDDKIPAKIQKLIDDNPYEATNPEMDFARWCVSNRDYSYDINRKFWFNTETLTQITWKDLFILYRKG